MPSLLERIRVVAFDLDGTLVDTAPDLALAANAMLESLGYPPLAPGWRRRSSIRYWVSVVRPASMASSFKPRRSQSVARPAARRARRYCR